jgi:hypothetical protein
MAKVVRREVRARSGIGHEPDNFQRKWSTKTTNHSQAPGQPPRSESFEPALGASTTRLAEVRDGAQTFPVAEARQANARLSVW